ncbi:hypothetical protein FKM82_014712 [Ascaphus truei]
MSDKEMLEDDIWEYKSIRKTKQSDKPAEINAAKKEQTKAVKPKRRGVRRAGSVASAKNTKRSQVPNGNIAQPSPTRDQNKRKQIPQADATTPTKKHTVNKKQSPRTPQPKHDGHCPSCQMPFSILLVQTPRWHASECLDTPGCNEKECPDGVMCTSTIPSHYKRYSHFQLAQSRALDDSVSSRTYTPDWTYSKHATSNISDSFHLKIGVAEKLTNNLLSAQNGNSALQLINKNVNTKSPKSTSPANSQDRVERSSLDAWLFSPSKNDKILRSLSQESLSNNYTGSLDAAKTSRLTQQGVDLSDCEISYSPLASDAELGDDDDKDKIKKSIKRLFPSESSEDNSDGTEKNLNGQQQGKDNIYHSKRENVMITQKTHMKRDDEDASVLNYQFPPGNENTSSQTFTCAANQPESHFKAVSINEGLDWLECNSPESVADCWFSDDLDYKFTSSAQGKEETFSVPSNEISNCMKSKERDFGTNSQRCERQLPKYKSSFSSLQTVVGEEEGLTFTQRTSTMPSKRQPSVPAVNAVTSKGMKQMDIGVFFGLKPKAKVEKDDVKLSLKSQSEVGPVGGKKPGKRKADGSVGDTESFADINKIPAGAVSGSQQRWRKKFRQSSTGEEGKGRKQCPFYKKMPGTGFTVDAFQYGEIEGCSAYFLTHFHSDHYGGLTKKFRFPIYCSKITGNLVQSKLRVEKEFINTLPMYTECVVNNITVVLLDANHCPGAVLFLFCLPNGTRILHTGDFRADHSMEKYSALIGQKIHSLYLDTTYCSPEYTFPPQQEAIQFAVNSAFEMVTLYPRTLVVCGTYSVGKEKVFLAIAHILGCKVSMSPDKCKTMQCLESEEIRSLVTTDWHSTALHVLPMMQVNFKGLLNHLNKFSGKYDRVLAFKPTGWTYSDRCDSVADIKPQVRGKITMYGIPYSEHSSYSEMKRFVQWLKPQKIIPTVNVGNWETRTTMEKYFADWISEAAQKPAGNKRLLNVTTSSPPVGHI